MLKELWILVKMLFASKPSDIDKVEVVDMRHFPFEGYKAMYWCGSIIHRIGASEVDDKTSVTRHFISYKPRNTARG